jgi:hypothetical protein
MGAVGRGFEWGCVSQRRGRVGLPSGLLPPPPPFPPLLGNAHNSPAAAA